MNVLKFLAGLVMILSGIVLSIYVGIVLMFVGGIVNVVDGAKANPADGGTIAWGVVKILFADSVALLVGVICVAIGAGLLGWRKPKPRFKPSRRPRF